MSDKPQAAICHNWLDQPDGPGWWWSANKNRTKPVEVVLMKLKLKKAEIGFYNTFGEWIPSRLCPGKWCRAIVPSLPSNEGET